MQDLKGKTAVVTGAGSGIGLGIARALAREGVNLALADIDGGAAEATREEVARLGVQALALSLDVSDRAAVYRAAHEIEAALGAVHILCNNAGVGSPGVPLDETPDADLDWMFAVNVFGVLNGIKAFVPKIKRHGAGGHIVNTASIAGLRTTPGWHIGLYSATKMSVVALSTGLLEAIGKDGIGVSVLCPAGVDTQIYRSGRARPARFGGPSAASRRPGELDRLLKEGLPPDEVGRCVVYAIRQGDMFFILTHPQTRRWIEDRHRMLMRAYDESDRMVETLGIPRTSQA